MVLLAVAAASFSCRSSCHCKSPMRILSVGEMADAVRSSSRSLVTTGRGAGDGTGDALTGTGDKSVEMGGDDAAAAATMIFGLGGVACKS